MATRVIDDSKLNNIAAAIQAKDSGGQMTVDEMPTRIEAIPSPPPTGRIIYSDFDSDGLPHTMEYVPASESDSKLPDRFISYGHRYTTVKWNSRIENIICPDHITELGIGGFSVGGVIKKLSNYDSIIIAGNSAFDGEINVWDYDYLPPNLKHIGSKCFCRNPLRDMSKFQLPNSVEYIDDNAFEYINARDSSHRLLLPSNLKYIGREVFFNNGFQLFPNEIFIPLSVEHIGNNTFGGGAYLTTTITFQGTPTTIEANAFKTTTVNNSMKSLTTINVPWSEGDVGNAPWGAINATINYNYTGE